MLVLISVVKLANQQSDINIIYPAQLLGYNNVLNFTTDAFLIMPRRGLKFDNIEMYFKYINSI